MHAHVEKVTMEMRMKLQADHVVFLKSLDSYGSSNFKVFWFHSSLWRALSELKEKTCSVIYIHSRVLKAPCFVLLLIK